MTWFIKRKETGYKNDKPEMVKTNIIERGLMLEQLDRGEFGESPIKER